MHVKFVIGKVHEDTVFTFFKIRNTALAFIIIDAHLLFESHISVGNSSSNVYLIFSRYGFVISMVIYAVIVEEVNTELIPERQKTPFLRVHFLDMFH